jgi:hypothetical protein
MTLEEINNIEDKAERLKLLRQFMKERQDEQTRQNESDAEYEQPLRDEAGGLMSTAVKKSG